MDKSSAADISEIFVSIQGEGLYAGQKQVFVRFAGCNLWTGREEDRASAVCRFCDTDFVGTDGTRPGGTPGPGDDSRLLDSATQFRELFGQRFAACHIRQHKEYKNP